MPYLEFGREVTRSTICVDRWQVTVTLMGPDRIPPGGTAPLLLVLTWRRRQDGGETPGRPDDAQPVVLTLRKATPAARGDIRFDGRDGPVVKGFGGVDVRGFLTLHGQAATAGAAADIVLAVSIEGQERGTIPLAVRAPEGDVAIRQENETDPAPDFLVPGRPARLKAARTPSGPGTFRWQSAVPDVLAIRGDARAEVAQVEVPAGSGAPGPPALVALAVLFTPQGGGPAVMAVHEVWPLTAPEAPGPYPVGRTAYTAPDLTIPAGLEGVLSDVVVRLEALVRYPAALAGDNTPVSARRARYPLVILAHGRHGAVEFERDPDGSPRLDAVCRRTPLRAGPTSFPEFKSHEGLEYLAAHLASHGMIAVSINLNGQFDPATGRGALVALGAGAATCRPFQVQEVGITHRGLTILRHIREMEDKDNGDPLFSGRINLGAIGLIGHSRGGEAVVSAGEINASTLIPPLQLAIKAIASIAPTDFRNIRLAVPYLALVGSDDGDVSECHGLRIYDRARPPKQLVWIVGGIHNFFSTNWQWQDEVPSAPPVSRAQHEAIAKGYCGLFLHALLNGVPGTNAYFTGQTRIAALAGVELHHAFRAEGTLTVDDFEDTPADRTRNSLGGAVTEVALARADETSLQHLDATCAVNQPTWFQDTTGLLLEWNSLTAKYTTSLGGLSASSFVVLSFRVGQNGVGNPVGPQDFRVRLVDGGGRDAVLQVSAFTTIPPARFKSVIEGLDPTSCGPVSRTMTLSALKTVRLPLAGFRQANPALDLSSLAALSFEFSVRPSGRLAFDEIEFSS